MRKFFVVLFFRLMIFANGKRRFLDIDSYINDVLTQLNGKVKDAMYYSQSYLDTINLASSKLREARKILNSGLVVVDRKEGTEVWINGEKIKYLSLIREFGKDFVLLTEYAVINKINTDELKRMADEKKVFFVDDKRTRVHTD